MSSGFQVFSKNGSSGPYGYWLLGVSSLVDKQISNSHPDDVTETVQSPN